jgi:hypothetical protein
VRDLLVGTELREACAEALEELRRWPGHEETTDAVERALALAADGPTPAPRRRDLGGAWVAGELASCALTAPTLEAALLLAVNHGGDSDSTGAITGQIVGVIHGEEAIPARWLDRLELREVIEAVAEALWQEGAGRSE